jgi:superfamily II DNA or RNA helicase
MRFTLKEYQSEATRKILTALDRSRKDWREYEDRTAFALSSTTGSGKTVIAATVIEALLHGSDEFDVEPDPTAVVLWVSKDPALNEQTRSRFVECATGSRRVTSNCWTRRTRRSPFRPGGCTSSTRTSCVTALTS